MDTAYRGGYWPARRNPGHDRGQVGHAGKAAHDRYTGPWNRRTASTILVMSLTGDPITTYQNAVAMTRDLARARLLTIAGWGHTELANPSTCAIRYEVSYMTAGALPSAGTVCAQNGTPFPVPSSGNSGQTSAEVIPK